MAKYRVPVYVEVELENDDLDGEVEAAMLVDETLQRAWETDRGRHHVAKWHFEIEPAADVERVTA